MHRRANRAGYETLVTLLLVLLPAGFAGADRVECNNGDVLIGKVVEHNDTVIVLEHDFLGRLEIPVDQVATVTIDTPPPVKQTVPAEGEETAAAEPSIEATGDEPMAETPGDAEDVKKEIGDWDLSLDLSLNSTTGNTDEQSFRFGLSASRITDRARLVIDFSYYWKATSSTTTDNKATLGVRNNWLRPESRWFMFASGRLDYDRFESWQQRINLQAGPGYHLIERENLTLDALGGIGVRKEQGSMNDDLKFEGLLGLDLTWQVTGRQRVTFDFTYFPTTDLEDYRFRSTAQWKYALDADFALSLVIGYLLEYQAIVDPGDEKTDFRMWIGLQYGF